MKKIHGMSRNKFYSLWNSMVMRCHNPKSKSFYRYGAKGITVCERWRVFNNFYLDMYPTYKDGLSLERKDNSKGYSPDNCKWATPIEQSNNTSRNVILDYNGEKASVSEMARRYGIPPNTLKRRLYRGWSVKEAIETPLHWRGKNASQENR